MLCNNCCSKMKILPLFYHFYKILYVILFHITVVNYIWAVYHISPVICVINKTYASESCSPMASWKIHISFPTVGQYFIVKKFARLTENYVFQFLDRKEKERLTIKLSMRDKHTLSDVYNIIHPARHTSSPF